MANEQNLIKNEDLTPEERRANARKAGIASGKARREKRRMKETLEILLSLPIDEGTVADVEQLKSISGMKTENITVQDAIMYAQIIKAMAGDTKAAEYVRDTSGNKLKEGLELSGGLNNPFAGMSTEELRKMVGND